MLNKRRSGLGALIPGAELANVGGGEMVAITDLAVNPYQPRRTFAPESIDELADSIRQYGILQPLSVRRRDGGYELIAGERRLQAARKAGLHEVPVILRECTDEEMLALALVENLQREDLNAMEAARSYHQLIEEFGLSQTEVAERVGKSRSTVANTMRLLALPSPIQQAIVEGAISEGHGRTLLAVDDTKQQQALFQETLQQGLSVRALEKRVQTKPRAFTPRKSSAGELDTHLQHMQSEIQMTLGTRVRFKAGSTGKGGTLEIDYYTPDDLDRLYEIFRNS